MIDVDRVRKALAAHQPSEVPAAARMRQAAVAAVLRDRPGGAEVLLIRRAEDDRDPWSGHMGFPGGRVDPGDASPLAAALRETREELALDLERSGSLLGTLSQVDAIGRGRRVGMVIQPFVFVLEQQSALELNYEVQEAMWIPLAFFLDGRNRSSLEWERLGAPITLPCYRWRGRVVWGLTLMMLDELMAVVSTTAPE